MKGSIISRTSAAILLALACCMDMGTNASAAPANSAAGASASAQVKALCDSSIAKSKAGDVAGAKTDIDQAIANILHIKLSAIQGQYGPQDIDGIESWQKGHLPSNPSSQKKMATVTSAIADIKAGNIDTAKTQLDSLSLSRDEYVNINYAMAMGYIVIGDFQKARAQMGILDTAVWTDGNDAAYWALLGDMPRARTDCANLMIYVKGKFNGQQELGNRYLRVAESYIRIGDFGGAQSIINDGYLCNLFGDLSAEVSLVSKELKRFQSSPTLCWGNPENPRRVAMGQVSKARCELALAQAKAGDMGAAKETLYFIIDEPDKIAMEKAIAQAGATFLQSGNVAKGIETLVVIPPAKQATAAQIRETTKTWVDIKSDRLPDIAAKLTEAEKRDLLKKLEIAILDCATQADVAKTLSIAAAQNGQGDPSALVELSNNYLNLQNVLKAVYKSLSEE